MNLYFDNGSTSFPKSECVSRAVSEYITHCGGSYSRGASQRTMCATSIVEHCRDAMARVLGVAKTEHIFFTSGATSAIAHIVSNFRGGNVVVSPLEHNAVMRSLRGVGATWSVLPHTKEGRVDVAKWSAKGEKLVIINLAGNVNGVVQDVAPIIEVAHKNGMVVALDVAQGAGCVPIKGDVWDADFIIFAGHKALGGIGGIGGFYAKNPQTLTPFICGGTGSYSHSYDMPSAYPERFEAGTPNIAGAAALLSALENPIESCHTRQDFEDLVRQIKAIKNLSVYDGDVELFSVVPHNMECSVLAERLYSGYGIETRAGLHCAPLAHTTLGTLGSGAVRLSLGKSHTVAEMDFLLTSLKKICSY